MRAVVLTQYRRVTDGQTDGQTDGNDIGSTALAMRALRRAVKTYPKKMLYRLSHNMRSAEITNQNKRLFGIF